MERWGIGEEKEEREKELVQHVKAGCSKDQDQKSDLLTPRLCPFYPIKIL